MTDKETIAKLKSLLTDDLYAESKDWRCGDLVERVEWLITMYDAKREEADESWLIIGEGD